jgi:hypothetical protein
MREVLLNLDHEPTRRTLMNKISLARGPHRVTVVRWKPRRSDGQNRLYWVSIVHPFGEFLREHGNEYTDDEAHEMLKHKFLKRSAANPATGEELEFTATTTKLTTEDFSEYLEQCSAWLAELGVFVSAPPANAGAAA